MLENSYFYTRLTLLGIRQQTPRAHFSKIPKSNPGSALFRASSHFWLSTNLNGEMMTQTLTKPLRNSGALLLALGLLVATAFWLFAAEGSPVLGQGSPSSGAMQGASIYQTLEESAVQIEATWTVPVGRLSDSPNHEGEETAFMGPEWRQNSTGIAFDGEGHILTGLDNVNGAGSINVILADGRWFPAEILGKDPISNLAVLEILAEDHGLKSLPMAGAEFPTIGEKVYAFGFTDGLNATLTKGIVSSIRGSSETPKSQGNSPVISLHSDILVLPGMTGGPLLNERGELIGLNTGNSSALFGRESLNNSIPLSFIETVVPVLAKGEEFKYPLSWSVRGGN